MAEAIQVEKVVSVYSGRAGACCCGCAGKHSYSSKHVALGSKRRGYAVRPEEVNDRMITKVTKILNKEPGTEIERGLSDGEILASVEVGRRLYVAYYSE